MSDVSVTEGVQYDHGGRRAQIVASLLADVFHGRLPAGRHLVTQELAERFGVSHTPVREALIALAGMGVVEILPNRGAAVRQVTARDVREIMQVRRALECQAVRSACGRIDLAALDALADELRRLATSQATVKRRFVEHARGIDNRLHDLIAASSGNRFLANELNRLKMLFRAFRDVSYTRYAARNDFRRLAEEAREHLAIVEALLAGDRREAIRAMARHLKGGLKYWNRSIPDAPPAARNGHAPPNGRKVRLAAASRSSRLPAARRRG